MRLQVNLNINKENIYHISWIHNFEICFGTCTISLSLEYKYITN